MSQNSPYRFNLGIICNFLQKPITLIVSIAFFVLFFVQATTNFLLAMNLNEQNISVNLISDPFPVIAAVCFLLLFIFAKRQSSGKSFKVVTTILRVFSVFYFVLFALALSSIIFLLAISGNSDVYNSILSTVIPSEVFNGLMPFLTAYLLPLSILLALYYIFFAVLLGSIDKSCNSVFLTRKGSTAFAVISFILALFYMFLIFDYLQLIPFIPQNMTVAGIIETLTTESNLTQSSPYFANTVVFTGIANAFTQLICTVIIGIFAITYRKYIFSLSDSINYADDSTGKHYSKKENPLLAANFDFGTATPMQNTSEEANPSDEQNAVENNKPLKTQKALNDDKPFEAQKVFDENSLFVAEKVFKENKFTDKNNVSEDKQTSDNNFENSENTINSDNYEKTTENSVKPKISELYEFSPTENSDDENEKNQKKKHKKEKKKSRRVKDSSFNKKNKKKTPSNIITEDIIQKTSADFTPEPAFLISSFDDFSANSKAEQPQQSKKAIRKQQANKKDADINKNISNHDNSNDNGDLYDPLNSEITAVYQDFILREQNSEKATEKNNKSTKH